MIDLAVFDEYAARYPAGWAEDSSSVAVSIALYGLVRLIQPSIVVEVGTFEGATSIWLARAVAENGRGRYIGFEAVPQNAAATEQALKRAVPGGAWTVRAENILEVPYVEADFLFLDHAKQHYPHALAKSLIPVGGHVAAHDTYAWPDAVRFYEWMTLQREWEVLNLLQERGLMIARKKW